MASQYVKGGVAAVLTKTASQKTPVKPSALQALFSQQYPANVVQPPVLELPKRKKKGKNNKPSMTGGMASTKKTSPGMASTKKASPGMASTKKASPGMASTKKASPGMASTKKTSPKEERSHNKRKQADSVLCVGQAKEDDTTPMKKQKLMGPAAPVKTHTKFPEETDEKLVKKDRKLQRENRRKKKRNEEGDSRTIFVGNLPKTSTKTSLQQLFKKYGAIESVRFRSAAPADLKLSKKAVITTKAFNKNRHTLNGYVVFADVESAKKALESNGTLYEGIHLRVDIAKNSNKVNNKQSVFIGNLPFDVEEEAVREHFEDCGTIKNVRIVRDGRTGLGKGFGYILFESEDGVTLALRLHEQKFKNRILRVQNCVEKETNSPSKSKQEKRQTSSKAGVRHPPGQSLPAVKETKRQNSGRSMPSNASSKDFQGLRAKQLSKIKKKQKQKSLKLKKKKAAKKLSQGAQKSTGNRVISARNRIAKKMKIKK